MEGINKFIFSITDLQRLNLHSTGVGDIRSIFIDIEESITDAKRDRDYSRYKKFDSVFTQIGSISKTAVTSINDYSKKYSAIVSQMTSIYNRVKSIKDISILPEYQALKSDLGTYLGNYLLTVRPIGIFIQGCESIVKNSKVLISKIQNRSDKQLISSMLEYAQNLGKELTAMRTRILTYRANIMSQFSRLSMKI